MADREQSSASRRETAHRVPNDIAGRVGESHGTSDHRHKESERAVTPGGTVGRQTPDRSKEHNTEIAVEAGRHGAEHRRDKR